MKIRIQAALKLHPTLRFKSEIAKLMFLDQDIGDATKLAYLANWETSYKYRQPTPQQLNDLADVLGCSTDFLLGRTEVRETR